ncbi:MAG: RNA polymerase sigma factor [Gaiellaceae bacterium]
MSLPQPDPSTVRKAQRGDEHAFAELVSSYELPVYNYVARMVGDRSLAEDLTQEIFLRVHHGIAGFSLRCRFTTWVFQIAKNRVLDELRARDRRPETESLDGAGRGLEVVDTPPEQLELVDAVWKAVGLLNPDLKMALLLRDVVGLSYAEIADSLEITLATVKWRIYKAREEVQRTLVESGMSEGLPLSSTAAATPS